MKSMTLPSLAACLALIGPGPTLAQSALGNGSDVVSVELLEGWREADGRHIAAIRLSLSEGWKTYWRAPGDGGLPTTLQWGLSDNLDDLRILWPRPSVFETDGMRSVGYQGDVVLPLELTPSKDGDINLNARLHFGVCKEVCVPAVVDLQHLLPESEVHDEVEIRSALGTNPIGADQAGVTGVRCSIDPTENGHSLSVEVMANLEGQSRAMVVELTDPEVWVSRTELHATQDRWHGVTQLFDHRDSPAAIKPNDVRITLLTEDAAVDIQGCDLR